MGIDKESLITGKVGVSEGYLDLSITQVGRGSEWL